MDDAKKGYREGEETAKEAWRKRDGEDLADKVGNLGDDISKNLGNLGDDVRRTPSTTPATRSTTPPMTPAPRPIARLTGRIRIRRCRATRL